MVPTLSIPSPRENTPLPMARRSFCQYMRCLIRKYSIQRDVPPDTSLACYRSSRSVTIHFTLERRDDFLSIPHSEEYFD